MIPPPVVEHGGDGPLAGQVQAEQGFVAEHDAGVAGDGLGHPDALLLPAAAAAAVTSSPGRAIALTILFAEVAAVGGMLLSLAPGVPVSVFVTTISFVIYLACRAVAAARR